MIEAMIDNETFGVRATSVVRSVGIVVFEGRTVLETHYFRIDEDNQQEPRTVFLPDVGDFTFAPRTKDQSTIDWWSKPENAKAQDTIDMAPIFTWDVGRTICGRTGDKSKRIWAKPGGFDLPMLRDLFGQDIWDYWKENDLATLLSEFDPVRKTRPKFEGIPHNALDDALHAHTWLCDLRDRLPSLIEESGRTEGGKIWTCKIGEVGQNVVPDGGDFPMRQAMIAAYRALTGVEPNFCFSGWGGALNSLERDVVQKQSIARYEKSDNRIDDQPDDAPGTHSHR